MGLLDGYLDPEAFEARGGLLGRLRSLQRQLGMMPSADPGSRPAEFPAPTNVPALRFSLGQTPLARNPEAGKLLGAKYAQAPLLCAGGPIPCAAGFGVTAGQAILGGAALGGLGALILNNDRARRPPAGSRPINETPWSGDHREIKRAINSPAKGNVQISPKGEVWAQNPDGSWTNHGAAGTFTGSGKPSGRRGRDRDR